MRQRRVQVRYTGHVQGVGFRFSTQRLAESLPVTGYVMNLPDGSVELVAEGRRGDLEALLESISTSHLGGYIHHAHVDWTDANGAFPEFSIRRTPR